MSQMDRFGPYEDAYQIAVKRTSEMVRDISDDPQVQGRVAMGEVIAPWLPLCAGQAGKVGVRIAETCQLLGVGSVGILLWLILKR